MFNTYAEVHAIFEHELNEYKSVQVTRVVHDFYDSDPRRGFYGGGGFDSRIAPPRSAGRSSRHRPSVPGAPAEVADRGDAAGHGRGDTRHVAAARVEPRRSRPGTQGRLGPAAMRVTYQDHPDDLACRGFLQDRAVDVMQAAGAQQVWKGPLTDAAGSPHLLGTCRMGNDRRPRWSTATIERTTSEPVHLRWLEPRHVRPRPAHDDDPGSCVPCRRAHRAVRAAGRNLVA